MDRVDTYISAVTRHPLHIVYELVQSVGKAEQAPETQPREHLQANNLKMRCLVVLFGDAKRAGPVTLNLSDQQNRCMQLADEASNSKNYIQQAEALILSCRFALLESKTADISCLDNAEKICTRLPAAKPLLEEVRELRSRPSDADMKMIVRVMAQEFRSTGHWYRCINGHPFTIGECGMPMQLARCPECDATIGGESHRAVGGVQSARDIEEQFQELAL